MKEYSLATKRKIRIIEEHLGNEWRDKYNFESIDKVYNICMSDNRKSVYIRINTDTRKLLDDMITYYDITIDKFIENLIKNQYIEYEKIQNEKNSELAQLYS